MFLTAASSAIALLFSVQAAGTDEQAAKPAPETTVQEAAEAPQERITDRSHPDFIRCRREPVIGSRARTTKRCLTNSQWSQLTASGNRDARQVVEDLQVGSNSN